ncbi:DUF262 domain-containing protein [Leptospira mtsangambouensis]|uniref:DUF262 domain-containing protein n=1 Tax=Leptospira mtsangambouensis TaxID=2484912 RepID=A0ABY2P5C7_9LEPT|nr:DUF262 domain-containing protein [Leptospira mtsangambouensis]TGM82439.1 DUF262 domain-containing protein [Leptospira mtsangambouensis]
MNRIDKSQIDIKGIGKVLSEGKLSVPPFQRSYSWEEKQINDLFEDINESISHKNEDYFLGSIVVLRKEDGQSEIVDGQQRIATTSILLTAIRDILIELGDNVRAEIIEKDYLFSRDIETLELIQNLELNTYDNIFYTEHIVSREKRKLTSFNKVSHEKLSLAYNIALKFIRKEIIGSKEKNENIAKWITFIKENVKVIWIQVEDYSYAYTIFETLNDRGLVLTVSDLLKNLLFSKAGKKINSVQSNWIEMNTYLEAIDKENLLVDFIRHYWSTQEGLTRQRELFSKIKNRITTSNEATQLSENLVFGSYYYTALLNTDHEVWEKYNNETRESISVLKMLGMQQNRPLLLSMLQCFDKKELELAVSRLLSWTIRFIVSGRLGSSGLEINFSEKAKMITDKKIKTADSLLEEMKKIIPSDEEFEKAFSVYSSNKPEVARYLLISLEKNLNAEKEPEQIPNQNSDQITLEHILPQKMSNNWNYFSEEDHQFYFRRIGNLCLLKKRSNSMLRDDSFGKKKSVYQTSMFKLTNSLVHLSEWNKDSIDKRQSELAKLAVKAWKLK